MFRRCTHGQWRLVVSVFLLLVLGTESHAFLGGRTRCDPTDNDRAEANRVIREIENMERAVIEALRLQTGQLAGYQAQSAKAVTQAMDSQTRLLAQIAREVEESRALRSHTPSETACHTVTGVAGLEASREGARNAYVHAGLTETGRIVADRAVVGSQGSDDDTRSRFEHLATQYCNGHRSGQDACTGPDQLHAADVHSGRFLDTVTLSRENDRTAAVELSRNLVSPLVFDPPAWGSATTVEEQRRLLLIRSAEARTALASDWFARMRAVREPSADLGAWGHALGADSGSSAPISRMALLEILASTRFESPDWFAALQGMGTDALLREIASLLAVSLTVDWESYRQAEQQGSMQAVLLAMETEKMRRLPGLSNPVAGVN